MAAKRKYFYDGSEYSYVKAHLRRRDSDLTEPAELGAFPFRRRVRLSWAHLLLLIVLAGLAYFVIRAGAWYAVAGIVGAVLALFILVVLIIRFAFRDRIRLAKLRKELAGYEEKDAVRTQKENNRLEEERLRCEIDSYKRRK